jgi:hypothetical protein
MSDQIAEALRETLISPNVSDANLEPANLVDVGNNIARALWCLARIDDSEESAGAVQLLAKEIDDGSTIISCSLDRVASALNNIADAIRGRRE